jgi:serine/threonine-protein kinase RsbW
VNRVSSRLVAIEGREELGRALDEIEACLRSHDVPEELTGEMRLVAEESLANVLDHAYADRGGGRVETLVRVAPDAIRLEIRDWGPAFDPLEVERPPLDDPLERRLPGGLGVHLMRSLTDEQSYARRGETNVLVLVKRRSVL